jgi:hypothetical protein
MDLALLTDKSELTELANKLFMYTDAAVAAITG